MKIGIVIPLLNKIAGNRLGIDIAVGLRENGQEVHFFSQCIGADAERFLKDRNFGEYLHYLERTERKYSGLQYLMRRLSKRSDMKLAKMIMKFQSDYSLDWIIVVANEGHYLPVALRKISSRDHPLTALVVMELIEHIFLLDTKKKNQVIRKLLVPLLPLLHNLETKMIREFDLLLSNSDWTSEMLNYFYGVSPALSIGSVDSKVFNGAPTLISEAFIAVPTVSLTTEDVTLLKKLHEEGVKFKAFGPKKLQFGQYLGFLDEESLRALLINANATLFLFDYEALGLIPLESLALGTPVITYPKHGPYFLLRDNPNVRFANNYEAIKSACLELINAEKTPSVRDSCRNSIKQFSVDEISDKLLAFLLKSSLKSENLN